MMTGLAANLWTANQDVALACAAHPFVRGLADGTLALAPDRDGLEAFHDLIGGVLEELKLHGSYAQRWGVDLSGVTPSEATLAYTDFLLSTARMRSLEEICAAMTPCMRLYAFLGQSLQAQPGASRYSEWIKTYASPAFETLAATLERLLNRYASDTPSVRRVYRRAMRLELAFFEAHAA